MGEGLRFGEGADDVATPTVDTESGVYRLWIDLGAAVRIRVGRLGTVDLPAGRYVYVGSARRNLRARLERHRRKEKALRWHIDYLLSRPEANMREIDIRPWRKGAECRWAIQTRREGGEVILKGFGASDCRSGCGAHLFRMPGKGKRRSHDRSAAPSR